METSARDHDRAGPRDYDRVQVEIRRQHDPSEPVFSTAEAAERLGISRQAVVQSLHRGSLAGYGIAGDTRTRWFVLQSAVRAREARVTGVADEMERSRERNRDLEEAVATLLEAAEQRRAADELLRESRNLDRAASDRRDAAWAALAASADRLEDYIGRRLVPSGVDDR